MIISIIGPVHGQAGNTTVALLISLLLSKSKSVCLTHLSAQSTAFYSNLGLSEENDPTCSPSQVAKLLRAGTITPKEMRDYCKQYNNNLDIFSNNSKAFTDDDMEIAAKYIAENMPHDFVVLDVDINPEMPLAKYAIEKSDIILLTLTQSNNVLSRYKKIFSKEKFPESCRRKTIYICNHFSPEICSIKTFAKYINTKPAKCCCLRRSEELIRMSNESRFAQIVSEINLKNLPDIEADFQRLETQILRRYKEEEKKKTDIARAAIEERKNRGLAVKKPEGNNGK